MSEVSLQPSDEVHVESADMYLEQNEFLAAEQGYKIALGMNPVNKDALLGLAHIASLGGHPSALLEYADMLLEHHSDDPFVVASVANIKEDTTLFARAYSMNPLDAHISMLYAKNLIKNNNVIDAALVLKAITCGKNLEIKLAVSELLIECSEVELSCVYLEDILKERPDSWLAYCHALPLFDHKKSKACDPEKVKEIISNLSTPADKVALLQNGLGKLLEKRGNHKESWEAYQASNDIVSKIRYNYADYAAVEKRYEEQFTKDFFDGIPESKESPFIFVFGMPRSGTTLTEQILGKHSDITALGELMAVPDSAKDFSVLFSSGSNLPNNPDELADEYLAERVRTFDTRYCVDKMPSNYKFIPLIYAMFPTAKFVYCKRNALDNCFSCLTTLFAKRHDYSFDQVEMGKEYNHHMRLMELWNDILPSGTIHQVDYEDMVKDQEGTTKELLDYIGLDYQVGCKDFHTLKRNVKTASLAQVVKPMYTTSVSRATPYLENLEPLIQELQDGSK